MWVSGYVFVSFRKEVFSKILLKERKKEGTERENEEGRGGERRGKMGREVGREGINIP